MNVWLCGYDGYQDISDTEILHVMDSLEKAHMWLNRQKEISLLHDKYHKDGTVKDNTSQTPEIIKLEKEVGLRYYDYNGAFIKEMQIT